MKKNQKIFLIIISIAFSIVLILLIKNRYSFGIWNPFSLPDRIECYNRRYYISSFPPQILNANEKPVYPISSSDNRTGKNLYTKDTKGEYVPTVIYLKMTNGKYQSYVLSGGP
jgi:hypothetical protein